MQDILSQIRNFRESESGIVTADFAVLLATIALLGFAVVNAFDDEVIGVANNIANSVAAVEVAP